MKGNQNSGVLAAGLALFSMFFGAGDLIWPLILGGSSGDMNFYAVLGLLITGVTLPLLGLISMMLFHGDYKTFFGTIGKTPSLILILIIQAILGPIGSIPRLITLSHATLAPYLPTEISLLLFSILASLLLACFCLKPQGVVNLLGLVLTPCLLITLGAILTFGFWNHPEPQHIEYTASQSFLNGLSVGYNTLDLIASFIFAPLVLTHFIKGDGEPSKKTSSKDLFHKMVKASFIAAALLGLMYLGLTYVSSYHTPLLDLHHKPEERLSRIALLLLGPSGALLSCIAVALTCLTTAIPLVSICSNYIRDDIFQGKIGPSIPLFITLSISCLIANIGFMGIAGMLSPILQILCPSLIVLSILNILNKLYETRISKVPVLATFAISTLSHVL